MWSSLTTHSPITKHCWTCGRITWNSGRRTWVFHLLWNHRINFVGGSIFVEFVRTSYQGINILHKLRNQSINILIHKILFLFVSIKNTRSYVPTNQCNFSNPWKLVPMNFNDITVYICTISIQFQYNCASIKAS